MGEIFRQSAMDKWGKEFETSRADFNEIRLEFEKEMARYLLYRAAVEIGGSSKTIYYTYRVPISKHDSSLSRRRSNSSNHLTYFPHSIDKLPISDPDIVGLQYLNYRRWGLELFTI